MVGGSKVRISRFFLCTSSHISNPVSALQTYNCYQRSAHGRISGGWRFIVTQSFTDEGEDQSTDSFSERMEAQCCQIRRYRREVIRKEGRQLSPDEAALEWIERYADTFTPGLDNH